MVGYGKISEHENESIVKEGVSKGGTLFYL
jgi:hypothetical protein